MDGELRLEEQMPAGRDERRLAGWAPCSALRAWLPQSRAPLQPGPLSARYNHVQSSQRARSKALG